MERLANIEHFLKRDLYNEALAGAVCNLALGNDNDIKYYLLKADYLDFLLIDTLIDFFVIDDCPDNLDGYIKAINQYKVYYNDGMIDGPIPTYKGIPLSEKLTTKEGETLKGLTYSFYEALRNLTDNLLTKTYAKWTDEDLEILGVNPEYIGPLFNRPVTLELSEDGEEYLRYFEDVLFEMIKRPHNELFIEDVITLMSLLSIFEYTMSYEVLNRPPVFIPRYYHSLNSYTEKLIIRYEKKASIYKSLIS